MATTRLDSQELQGLIAYYQSEMTKALFQAEKAQKTIADLEKKLIKAQEREAKAQAKAEAAARKAAAKAAAQAQKALAKKPARRRGRPAKAKTTEERGDNGTKTPWPSAEGQDRKRCDSGTEAPWSSAEGED